MTAYRVTTTDRDTKRTVRHQAAFEPTVIDAVRAAAYRRYRLGPIERKHGIFFVRIATIRAAAHGEDIDQITVGYYAVYLGHADFAAYSGSFTVKEA